MSEELAFTMHGQAENATLLSSPHVRGWLLVGVAVVVAGLLFVDHLEGIDGEEARREKLIAERERIERSLREIDEVPHLDITLEVAELDVDSRGAQVEIEVVVKNVGGRSATFAHPDFPLLSVARARFDGNGELHLEGLEHPPYLELVMTDGQLDPRQWPATTIGPGGTQRFSFLLRGAPGVYYAQFQAPMRAFDQEALRRRHGALDDQGVQVPPIWTGSRYFIIVERPVHEVGDL